MSRDLAPIPESLHDVAETLGLGVALRLMQHYGGQEVEFPRRLKDEHELISVLGRSDAEKIVHLMSGARVYIPHGRSATKRLEVERLEADGKARREIAKALGLSQRHVRRLANKPPDQLPLFPDD